MERCLLSPQLHAGTNSNNLRDKRTVVHRWFGCGGFYRTRRRSKLELLVLYVSLNGRYDIYWPRIVSYECGEVAFTLTNQQFIYHTGSGCFHFNAFSPPWPHFWRKENTQISPDYECCTPPPSPFRPLGLKVSFHLHSSLLYDCCCRVVALSNGLCLLQNPAVASAALHTAKWSFGAHCTPTHKLQPILCRLVCVTPISARWTRQI